MTLRGIIWAAVSTSTQAEDDKTSIPSQIEDGKRWAGANGVHIIDTLVVPGHSRRYTRIEQCSRDMLKQGIDAFDKLMKHWAAKDFDVLIIRDGNRFARTQALHATVIEETINIGARLFSLSDGWVDENNYRWFISMNGYMAASYIDHFVKGSKKTKEERSSRGIPTGPRTVFSHKAIRNEYGKIISFVVDESKRRLLTDVKTLLVKDKVSWVKLEKVLYERYGHARPDGKPFKLYFFYRLLYNPWFWGHAARYYRSTNNTKGEVTDLWAFDPDVSPPKSVRVWYNTHESFFTGKEAEELKAELRRRRTVIRGTARPHRTHRFSGLLICELCGYRMTYSKGARSQGYMCRSTFRAVKLERACPKTWFISSNTVQDWIDAFLRVALEGDDPFDIPEADNSNAARINALKVEIADVENQVRRLIAKQASAPDTLVALYDEQIHSLGEQVKILRDNLVQAERNLDREEHKARTDAMGELRSFEDDLERFWQQSDVEINQWLHRFFGRWRLRVKDHQIIGLKRV